MLVGHRARAARPVSSRRGNRPLGADCVNTCLGPSVNRNKQVNTCSYTRPPASTHPWLVRVFLMLTDLIFWPVPQTLLGQKIWDQTRVWDPGDSSQGDVRSSPMAYPAVRALPKLPLLLRPDRDRRGLPLRRRLRVPAEHDPGQRHWLCTDRGDRSGAGLQSGVLMRGDD